TVAYLLPEEENKPDRGPSKSLEPHSAGRDAPVGSALAKGRGRSARDPSEMPAKGWKDILYRVYENISDHRVLALAAGMTFYSLLAIFPALAALVAVYGLF